MLTSIQTFIQVVESGSFSKAAVALSMAPSSVTRSIDALEKELNTKLFERSTRQLKLTDKGHAFLSGAQQLLDDVNQLRINMSDDVDAVEGSLRISAFETFGRLHLCSIITDFLALYPNINIDLDLENKVVDLISENIDVAIRIGVPADSQLKARTIFSNRMVVCASPEYLSKQGQITQPNDLSQHNCLVLNQGRQKAFWYFQKGGQMIKVLVSGNLKSKGGTPLLNACLNGLGIVQLSHWAVADYIKRGELVACLQDWTPNLNETTSGDVYALYKKDNSQNHLVRLFIDFVLEKTQAIA